MSEAVGALLAKARQRLKEARIETAALDARVLLQHAVGLAHEDIVAAPERIVPAEAILLFEAWVARRLTHEPVAKIVGGKEFYGRWLEVSRDVLDPRPDTETVVQLALDLFKADQPFCFTDLGSGSGAIGITLLAERPLASGVAVDVSAQARAITFRNAERHGVAARLAIVDGPWFAHVPRECDLVISNPPYIARGEIAGLEASVRSFDPQLALDGGPDGLECYRAIAAEAGAWLSRHGKVVVETGAGQAAAVCEIFRGSNFTLIEQRVDLGGIIRALAFQQP